MYAHLSWYHVNTILLKNYFFWVLHEGLAIASLSVFLGLANVHINKLSWFVTVIGLNDLRSEQNCQKVLQWGALPPQPHVGAPPQNRLCFRLHEYFSCLKMHLVIILNITFSQDSGAYSMQLFYLGGGRLAAFWGLNPKCLI